MSGTGQPLSSEDVKRYVWLFILTTLLLLVLAAAVENGFVILLAVYLAAFAVAGLVHLVRRRRRS